MSHLVKTFSDVDDCQNMIESSSPFCRSSVHIPSAPGDLPLLSDFIAF